MNTPAEDHVVKAPATDLRPVPQPGPSDRPPVDNSHVTTTPVPVARHHAPPHQDRWVPAPTAQFHQASAAPPRPGVYSSPAAYSATPYPAQPSHTPANPSPVYSQAHPGRLYPPESYRGPRPPQPYPAGQQGPMQPPGSQSAYRQAGVDPGAIRMTTTQRPHRRVDTSVLCAAAALIVLALGVLLGLML